MKITDRNNVHVQGEHGPVLLYAHDFACSQAYPVDRPFRRGQAAAQRRSHAPYESDAWDTPENMALNVSVLRALAMNRIGMVQIVAVSNLEGNSRGHSLVARTCTPAAQRKVVAVTLSIHAPAKATVLPVDNDQWERF